MAARDPSTGQFLPAGADRTVDAAFEDFDIQQVRLVLDFDDKDASDSDTIEPFHTSEPLGGLQRDELAELVALRTRVSNLAHSNATTGAVTQTMSGELSFDADSHMIDPGDAVETLDVNGEVDVDRLIWEQESDPDVLDHWAVESNWNNDNTNGTGASTLSTYDNWFTFRPVYGRGPVLDRHSDLFWHLRWVIAGTQAAGAMTWHTDLVWDVFARGQG